MRIGKPLEHVQALIKCQSVRDDVIRLLAMGKSAAYAIYLFNDMLSWVRTCFLYHRVEFLSLCKMEILRLVKTFCNPLGGERLAHSSLP